MHRRLPRPIALPLVAAGRGVWRALPLAARRGLLYRRAYGRFPRRAAPQRFSEKLDWRLLQDRRDLLVQACDKLAAKDVARSAGLTPARTLWAGTDVAELAGADLGDRWVLKPNHRGGGLVHLGEGEPDVAALTGVVRGWLDPSSDELRTGEWAYGGARRLLLVEERLGPPGPAPVDWKVHVFDGEPALVQVHLDRFGEHQVGYYRPDWTPVTSSVGHGARPADPVAPPERLDELLAAASRLGRGWDYVRVDLYDVPEGVRFGELTVYPGSGLVDFRAQPWLDAEMGSRWTLPGEDAASTAPRPRG